MSDPKDVLDRLLKARPAQNVWPFQVDFDKVNPSQFHLLYIGDGNRAAALPQTLTWQGSTEVKGGYLRGLDENGDTDGWHPLVNGNIGELRYTRVSSTKYENDTVSQEVADEIARKLSKVIQERMDHALLFGEWAGIAEKYQQADGDMDKWLELLDIHEKRICLQYIVAAYDRKQAELTGAAPERTTDLSGTT